MNSYKVLNKQVFTSGEYALVPIRMEDRYDIMKWRNEQIYHLRQKEPLTREQQDQYFNTVVASLFSQEKPDQILFSFLKNDTCIGYGGLVHINWCDRNAEISFVMDTTLENDHFKDLWGNYLELIEKVAFSELSLHKIYTWAFDLRPQLYDAIESKGFVEEARLKEHCLFGGRYIDVVVHGLNSNELLNLRLASNEDCELLFQWANDNDVRRNSFSKNAIKWEDHRKWFENKMNSDHVKIFVLEESCIPVGQVRIEYDGKYSIIDYSIDKNYRGKGLGKKIIQLLITNFPGLSLKAIVKTNNIPSIKVFETLGFEKSKVNTDGESSYVYVYK